MFLKTKEHVGNVQPLCEASKKGCLAHDEAKTTTVVALHHASPFLLLTQVKELQAPVVNMLCRGEKRGSSLLFRDKCYL